MSSDEVVRVFPGRGDDTALGGSGHDDVESSKGDDRLNGGVGRDGLFDTQGIDVLRGGRGSDWCLWSEDGIGDDTIVGGPGKDMYIADSDDKLISAEVVEPNRCD